MARKLSSLLDPGANPINTFIGRVGCQAQVEIDTNIKSNANNDLIDCSLNFPDG
jgi:hypothetical protein